MFVRDHPPPIDFLQAHCQTKIERFGLAVGPGSGAAHRRDREGGIVARGDIHLLNVEADWFARPGKEQVPCLPVGFEPNAFEWWRNIEHHEIGGMALENPA